MHELILKSQRWKMIRIFFHYLVKRMKEAMILRVASSLSYTTLIAVVPLIAMAVSVFTAFPIYENVQSQVQDFLIQYFLPDMEQNIQSYFNSFVDSTKQLTTIGVIGISITSILLLYTIENSFNFIFKVSKKRRLATRITLYWTIITLGPLLLGTAFSLKGYLFTLSFFNPENIGEYNFIITSIISNILTIVFLMMSYFIVPNKKIRFTSALCGAFLALILMSLLRFGFGYYILFNGLYKTLYGTLTTIPVLLIWMYSWWTIIIFGAIFTAALEEFRYKRKKTTL